MKHVLHSKTFHALLGFFISGAIIAWLYLKTDWSEVGTQLGEVNHWIFFPITAIFAFQFFLRAIRWRYLLSDAEHIPLRSLYDSIMLGNYGNYLLPLRAGEFLRPFLLARESAKSFSSGFVSVVIERFFDLSMVLLTFGIMLLFLDQFPPFIYQGAAILSLVAIMIFAFIVLGGAIPNQLQSLADFVLGFLPEGLRKPLSGFVRDFLEGAAVLHNPKNLIGAVLFSVLVWAVTYSQFYVTLYLLNMPVSIGFSISVAVIIALGVALPSAPGFIGVIQGASVVSFAIFGYSKESAMVFSIIAHLYQYLFIIVYGFYLIFRYGVRLGDLRSETLSKDEAVVSAM